MMIVMPDGTFGRNLHDLRRRRRISLARLAELTRIPYLTLYCIENGTLREIDEHHLRCLCHTLRTTAEELIGKL